jgi:ABC-type cobalamin/Fe3+-siderophores transport system ATPase subunit
MITHLVELAMAAAHRVVLIAPEHGEVRVGPPAEIRTTEAFRHLYGMRA